jgi:hypothetical protein
VELWHDYTFYSFIFLNSEKNEPRRAVLVIHVLFLLTPPSFGHLPYILLCKTQGREGEMYFLFALISVKCDTMGGEIAFFFFGI